MPIGREAEEGGQLAQRVADELSRGLGEVNFSSSPTPVDADGPFGTFRRREQPGIVFDNRDRSSVELDALRAGEKAFQAAEEAGEDGGRQTAEFGDPRSPARRPVSRERLAHEEAADAIGRGPERIVDQPPGPQEV